MISCKLLRRYETCTNYAVWDRDECINLGVKRSKVKGRGHSGVKHVGNSTVLHSWRHTALDAATKLVSGQFNKTVQL